MARLLEHQGGHVGSGDRREHQRRPVTRCGDEHEGVAKLGTAQDRGVHDGPPRRLIFDRLTPEQIDQLSRIATAIAARPDEA
jgi:hypothetical protein